MDLFPMEANNDFLYLFEVYLEYNHSTRKAYMLENTRTYT